MSHIAVHADGALQVHGAQRVSRSAFSARERALKPHFQYVDYCLSLRTLRMPDGTLRQPQRFRGHFVAEAGSQTEAHLGVSLVAELVAQSALQRLPAETQDGAGAEEALHALLAALRYMQTHGLCANVPAMAAQAYGAAAAAVPSKACAEQHAGPSTAAHISMQTEDECSRLVRVEASSAETGAPVTSLQSDGSLARQISATADAAAHADTSESGPIVHEACLTARDRGINGSDDAELQSHSATLQLTPVVEDAAVSAHKHGTPDACISGPFCALRMLPIVDAACAHACPSFLKPCLCFQS